MLTHGSRGRGDSLLEWEYKMGSKLESYVDEFGNTVKDDDTVIYKGKEYKVRYISTYYVNLSGDHGGLHLTFNFGKPYLKDGVQSLPVKITTITKKEIVPRTYGDVRVGAAPKRIYVDVVQQKTKLAEVIKTLQTIHDAME